ncbi:MAG: sodium-independent anion transporter, partial [Gammaproteobacteria bacterium]|nr:sodium-independent anion transporter [Gammaproteobacteria bacterium]
KHYVINGPLFFSSVHNFSNIFTPNEDPDHVIVDFSRSRVYDHSAIEAIDSLADRYVNLGKKIHLKHLSPECKKLLKKAGDLVEVNIVEDPKYFVADDRLA